MKWATRPGLHVDRTGCAWLIRNFIDPNAEFSFVAEADELREGVTGFDMRGVELTHHGEDCSFETILKRYELGDPALWAIARIIHQADLEDDLFDAPEAAGIDVAIRGLSMIFSDDEILARTDPLFDGLYAYLLRATRHADG